MSAPRLLLSAAVVALVWGHPAAGEEGETGEVEAGEESVEVVGEREPEAFDPLEATAAVTVIAVDERLRASAEVADAVGAIAGVHLQRLGGLGGHSVVTVRGSSARQVEVHVDGVPLNPHGGAAVDLAELSLDGFERIEVYRSGAPAHLGSAAMGGVVNLVSAGVPAPRLEIMGGSLWTRRLSTTAGAATHLGRVPLDVRVDAETFGTEGDFEYFDDHGTAYNLMDDRVRTRLNNDVSDLKGRVRVRLGTRQLRLVIQDSLLVRERGLPGIGQDPALHARFGVADNALLTQVSGRPRWNLNLDGRLTWRGRKERYQDPEGELGTGNQDSRDQHDSVGLLVNARWLPLAWQVLGATAELRVDGYRPQDLQRDDPDDGTRMRVAGVFSLAEEISVVRDRVRFSPVLQLHLLDNRMLGTVPFGSTDVAPQGEQRYAEFTPRVGLLVRPLDVLSLKGNLGRAFRPPDFTELFGDRGAVIGNTDLVPESAVTWDAGVRVETPANPVVAGSLSAAYFWRDTRDAIVYVQNAQRTQVPINLGRARVSGVEGSAELLLADLLDLRANVTWMDSVNLDEREAYTDNQLPRLPRWEVWFEAAVHWRGRVRLSYDLSHTAGNYWDATNWYLAAPRTLHGLALRVQPGPGWPYLEVDLRNLLDTTVEAVPRDPLNPDDGALVVQALTDFSGYPLPGRTLLITVGWRGEKPGGRDYEAAR